MRAVAGGAQAGCMPVVMAMRFQQLIRVMVMMI
jgi:hypothetical protein